MDKQTNITLQDLHDIILDYLAQGKDISDIEVIADINNNPELTLYLDQSEIQDNVFIIRN